MSDLLHFRRRKRPGWIRPSEGDRDSKRLIGLDEFTTPEFVGRMERVRRRRERAFTAVLIGAVLAGAAIGVMLL